MGNNSLTRETSIFLSEHYHLLPVAPTSKALEQYPKARGDFPVGPLV